MKKRSNLILFFVLVSSLTFNMCANPINHQSQADFDVVIVGGGFSGLLCAYNLEGKKVLVLEKEKLAGGRCASGHWNGFHYPKGTEYIGKPERYMRKIFNDLEIQVEQLPAPTDGIAYNRQFYLGNKLLDFLTIPEKRQYHGLIEELSELAKSGIEKAVFDKPSRLAQHRQYDQISVKEWLDRKDYPSIIQKFVDIENRGLFGTDNSNFSMLFNIPEMAFDLPVVSSINDSEVYSFKQGMYSVIDALSKRLGKHLITGASVNDVYVNNDRTVTVTYIRNGQTVSVKTKSVVMATPAPITSQIISNHLSKQVKETLSNIRYSKYATINFFLNKRLLHETWSISCIDEGSVVTLYDVIRPQVKNDYRGKSILSTYMAPESAYDKTFIYKSDQELVAEASQVLRKYYPDFDQSLIDYDVTRFKHAFPIFSPNYLKKIHVLNKDASLKGPIFLAGDYLVYATVDGALISAENAAEQVWEYIEN